MRFITGVIVGIVIALTGPAGAAEPPTPQGDGIPAPELAIGECNNVMQVDTFTVTNKQGATRVVTKSTQDCGGGYTLITRYKSPWVTQ